MRSTLASILIDALLSVTTSRPALVSVATSRPTLRGKTRGKGSINYAARAARSHAGKPAGYVKAY